ncbi:MAG TPA: metallophosphoesterase family protein [Candidatus Limnocylindrales bacterium]|nr:metallophosphoesterase family protein [Candidatus Limnocylindrales bacterium]
MRVALLSDVHANLQALEAVLAAVDADGRPDALWVTGDTVGYGADPSDVLALLRERGATLLQGNHDRAVATGEGLEWFHERAAQAARSHAEWLSAEERDFLKELPLVSEVDRFTLCHGSLRDPLWEYVTDAAVATASLALSKTPFACNGHTHVPALFGRVGAELRFVPSRPDLAYTLGETAVLNPGSVGQPRDGDPRAAFVVVDTAAATATFRRVGYEILEAQRRIRARGLPEMFAERLALGL